MKLDNGVITKVSQSEYLVFLINNYIKRQKAAYKEVVRTYSRPAPVTRSQTVSLILNILGKHSLATNEGLTFCLHSLLYMRATDK